MHTIIICLLTFSACFFCLSAAQNSLSAGERPAGSAPYAADEQKKRAKKVKQALFSVKGKNFQETIREVKG
jgi:hypothetical protein